MRFRLLDIMDLIGGGTPKTSIASYWGGDIPWLSVKDFNNDYRYVYETEKTITEDGLNNSSTKLLGRDDSIISARGTVGAMAMIPFSMAFNQSCYGLRAKKEIVDPTFLYYLVKHNVHVLQKNTHGSVFDTITKDTFAGIEVDVPNMDNQLKIASILRNLDDKIELNTKINENLLQQAQAILKAFFIDFSHFGGQIPTDWEQGTLQDIVDFSNGYAFKSKELLDAPAPDCYHVFKQGHINRGGGFNSNGTKSWYPINKCTNLSKYVLRKGDILMAMTDMKDNVAILGNTALMTVDNQYIVNQRVGLLRSNGYRSTSYSYIYLLTNSFDFLKDLRSRANSGVQVNLSSTEIKDSPVLIATDDVNKEFNSLTEPLLSMIMTNDIENQKLAKIRDALLPQLMSGELDVSRLDY